MEIRPARDSDAQAVRDIYAFHVAHSTATFDTIAPDVQAWAEKIAAVTARGWPFFVAVREGVVVGYCYATQFRDRAAYAKTCEDSIYVAEAARGQGIGTALLMALVAAAREAGFEQMVAVIGGGEPASVALHRKCGFVHTGRMRHVGFKFGRKLDTVYMQCDLTGEGWAND
ncbi:GNAT family N-acetyltransferase [Erythrobacter dokdonensis]|uniref:Putative acetyltransferase n=1 Tax=Erythrobacter dokdonensis DSW-74 TaxID=1300349 RepID=A0A1A7BJ06_9SPHN|nr:GNAT family N-acetyltransferase [Erythrobacter dokdonensis]OBV12454.1 putative acetyltransferase [Erythrobacter dokdonensis DSW-74]